MGQDRQIFILTRFMIITALKYYKKAMQIGTLRNNVENKNLTHYRCR